MRPLSRSEMRARVVGHAALLDAGAVDNPFASAAWTLHFIDHVARDDWTFWLVGEERDAAGLTLLYCDPARPHDARALNNYYASLFSPAVGASSAERLSELPQRLAGARPPIATVNLAPLSEGMAVAVRAAFDRAGWITRQYACFGNWYLPSQGLDFATYMAARPSQLVNTWSRKAKKFHRAGGEARLQLVTLPDQVDAAMKAYDTVYAKSWKVPEPYPRFVHDWAAICAANGWLRMGIAWVGDTPIAAQFWFTVNGRASIFKLAYDEDHAKWSAGTVLSAFLFEHSLDVDRVTEIDYLTGDDAYKQAWMTERRERFGVIACNPRTWRGLARGAYEWAGAARLRWRSTAQAAPVAEPAQS
jgi:hypothetical protein